MMTSSKHRNHWRALVGALAVAGLAFGLSLRLEGAALMPGGLSGQDQRVTLSADEASRVARSALAQRRASTGEPVVYGNMANLRAGDVPTFPTIRVDYRDDDATRMREAGLLEGPLPMTTSEGGVASGTLCLANCTGPGAPFACCTGAGTGTCTCCSFVVDCDDGNRCTTNACTFPPGGLAGSGTCESVAGDGSIGNAQCPGNFGLACGGCDDGLFCNGVETCSGGSCVAGTNPCIGSQICSETIEAKHCSNNPALPCVSDASCGTGNTCEVSHCQDLACVSDADCHNAAVVGAAFKAVTDLTCNGTETCAGGVCVAGTNPCGSGGVCGERQCSVGPAINFCITDEDCFADGTGIGGTCSLMGPVCKPGRCCLGSTEPECTRRLNRGICNGGTAGTNGGAACLTAADCQSRYCSVSGVVASPPVPCTSSANCPAGGVCPAASNSCPAAGPNGLNKACDFVGGTFYGWDDGTISGTDEMGSTCPVREDILIKCPKYGSGIAPSGLYPQLLGPISNSPVVIPPFGVALQKLGDDYTLSNPGVCTAGTRTGLGCNVDADCTGGGAGSCNVAGTSYYSLDYLRFAGGSPATDRISFEFYDEFGNFVEDLFFSGTAAFGIYPVLFDPPISIPSKGFVVQRVAQGFSPNARHVWASTEAVDVGSNDPGRMWVNGGAVNSNFGTTGILAFELEGTKAAGSFGACCYTNPDVCNNAVAPYVCRGTGGKYLGNSTNCAACDVGLSSSQYCRRCSNNAALSCNRDSDCGGTNTCIPTNSACDQSGPTATCVAEPSCAEGGCCNPTTGACTVELETACISPRTYLGNGSDCDSDHGYDSGQQHCCPQPVSSYSGRDNCEDIITDGVLHVISAPPIGQTSVLTITGNNTNATSDPTVPSPTQGLFGDSCFPPSQDPNLDPGWWQGFTLTDPCTIIYVDHCCTNPVHRPAYRVLYNTCPCGPAIFTQANPYLFPEPPDSRGLPYCADDDNAWQCFGLLPPGTYYYPIYSALAGHHGDYQFHIVAKACPTAACCTQDECVDGLTQFQCDALGGFLLAPPNKSPAVDTCTAGICVLGANAGLPCAGNVDCPGGTCNNSTCSTGSCCRGPGLCEDVVSTQPVTRAACETLNPPGNFIGGVRCEGGTCSNSAVVSCDTIQDCIDAGVVGGTCTGGLGGAQALAQPNPCPICEMEGIGNCQAFDDTLNFTLSDRHQAGSGLLKADDVKPDGDTLSQVCVWGFYLDVDPLATVPDCSESVTLDHFRVRVFENDPATGRSPLPGPPFASSTATSEKGKIPGSQVLVRVLTEQFGYQLTLDTPITGLTPGATYWIEVSNDVSESSPTCAWFWNEQQQDSSSYSYSGTEAGYAPGFESPFEMVFCTNFTFTPSTTGDQVGACCTCDGLCSLKTYVDCGAINGAWDVFSSSCTGVVCPIGAPANDNCPNAVPIVHGSYVVKNQCATTDGYGPIPSDTGDTQLDYDLWYELIAGSACNLEVSECASGRRFDSMLAVYMNCPPGSPPSCDKTVCPPCPSSLALSDAHLAGTGRDDNCTHYPESDGVWLASEQILRNAEVGECFLLRIGSFPGNRGTAALSIDCPGGGVDPPAVAPQSNATCTAAGLPHACCSGAGTGVCDKARFISFNIPSAATAAVGETAIRIKLTSLHHVSPPYTGAASIPFTTFEGQSVYVGAPVSYIESNASGTPFKASSTQCTPLYMDWSTVGLLHVTGPGIVPSSNYTVEHLGSACNGSEGSCTNFATGVPIRTVRWGDVETPYNPPSVTAQPDVGDISALVKKFQSGAGAVIKARGLIAGVDAFGDIDIFPDLGFGHISACVDAFRGGKYPYQMGMCTSSFNPCTFDTDCAGTTGPCKLFAMGKCTGAPTPPATGNCTSSAQCTGTNGAGPCIPFFGCP